MIGTRSFNNGNYILYLHAQSDSNYLILK
ncbi:DUF6856 family protein [Bacteroides reticulotermitis]